MQTKKAMVGFPMRILTHTCAVAFIAIMSSCPWAGEDVQCGTKLPCDISLVRLIATPSNFDGVKVRLKGYVRVGKEDDFLFFDQDSCDSLVVQNAVALDFTLEQKRIHQHISGRLILVEGDFYAYKLGEGVSGIVRNVTRIDPFVGRQKK